MLKILHLAGAAGILGLFAIPAQAQQAKPAQCDVECTCWTPLVPSPVGSVVSSGGIVQASTATGYGPAPAGTPLNLGSQMTIGAASQANIVVGAQCNLDITSNSDVTVTEQCGQICVQVTQNTAPPVVAGGGALPLIILGTGAAVAAGIILLDDDDEGGGGGGRPASN